MTWPTAPVPDTPVTEKTTSVRTTTDPTAPTAATPVTGALALAATSTWPTSAVADTPSTEKTVLPCTSTWPTKAWACTPVTKTSLSGATPPTSPVAAMSRAPCPQGWSPQLTPEAFQPSKATTTSDTHAFQAIRIIAFEASAVGKIMVKVPPVDVFAPPKSSTHTVGSPAAVSL